MIEYCIFNTRTNRYFFHTTEDMVDSYLSVHYSNYEDEKKSPWLVKKSRRVEDWKCST